MHVKLVEYSRYLAYEYGNLVRQGIFKQASGSNNRELKRELPTGRQVIPDPMPSSLCITLSHPQGVYSAGTSVSGAAQLDLTEPMKAFARRTQCFAPTLLPRDDLDISSANEKLTDEIPKQHVLPAGSHNFPFAFNLPENCPPSFESAYGYIRYMVKVELDRPWRFNKKERKLFTGKPTFN
ncbi:unnamed protein product [Strongylus vulgaris]|uniref:Arrestin-like N-terminal domain-containing protein n=1 Tax=Strongylus vulgaris TaxID=40348 RepID=A0A3P7J089_STRVU|nr:unnamed protein product [Strongylus vulgaris]